MDERAFHEFYAATARALRAYAAHALGDRALADDVVQESCLRLLRMPNAPDDPDELRRLAFRIASNVMNDEWRRRGRLARAAAAQAPEAITPSPDYARRLDMLRVFARLEPRQRQMMWLAYVEGENHAAIAATLGLREGSVKVLLHRARRKLASLMK